MTEESATGITIPTGDDLGSSLSQTIPDIVEALEGRSAAPVASDAERNNLYPAPTVGQTVLRTDLNQFQMFDGLVWRSQDIGPAPVAWGPAIIRCGLSVVSGALPYLSLGSGVYGGYIRQDFNAIDFTFHMIRAADSSIGGSAGGYSFTSPVNVDFAPGQGTRSWGETGTWGGFIGGVRASGVVVYNSNANFVCHGKFGDIGQSSGSDYGSGWQATDYIRGRVRAWLR